MLIFKGLHNFRVYLDLPKGAKWFLKSVNSPSLIIDTPWKVLVTYCFSRIAMSNMEIAMSHLPRCESFSQHPTSKDWHIKTYFKPFSYPSSHNHGSGTWIPSIFVSFHLGAQLLGFPPRNDLRLGGAYLSKILTFWDLFFNPFQKKANKSRN